MSPRTYESPRRSLAAADTRAAILKAAMGLFTAGGYSATTVAMISAAAGVSPNTVYVSVGGKPQLVLALISAGVADPLIASTLSGVGGATDGRQALRVLGSGVRATAEHLQETIAVMYDAAASEPLVAAAVRNTEAIYRDRLGQAARHLIAAGFTSAGMDHQSASDILWFYFGMESWRSLTALGWDFDRAERWLTEQAGNALLGP